MKIIYAASNRIGANIQLSSFLKNIDNKIELKIAAYGRSYYNISHADWNINSVFVDNIIYNDLLSYKKYNQKNIEYIINDVLKFSPDLIISDNEYIFGLIANEINIPLWYCSPLNLIDGIEWEFERKIYSYFIYKYKYNKLPKADKYLIYSPFCDIKNSPKLKKNYNWIRPYYSEYKKISIDECKRKEIFKNIFKYIKANDYCFTDGNTNSVSDSIYNNKKIIVSPSIKNIESLINALLVEKYNIGCNLGQIELMKMLSIDEIQKAYDASYSEIEFNGENHLQLHEYIEEYKNNL